MKEISAEQRFSVPVNNFAISPSDDEYTLMYSADGVDFTAWTQSTPANEVLVVNNFPKNMVFYLSGNTSDVVITY